MKITFSNLLFVCTGHFLTMTCNEAIITNRYYEAFIYASWSIIVFIQALHYQAKENQKESDKVKNNLKE